MLEPIEYTGNITYIPGVIIGQCSATLAGTSATRFTYNADKFVSDVFLSNVLSLNVIPHLGRYCLGHHGNLLRSAKLDWWLLSVQRQYICNRVSVV